jgi:chitin synthase
MACLVGFAIIMCYMLFCSSWLIYKGIQLAGEKYEWTYNTTTNFQIAMNDPGLRNMVISLSSTYGIYLVSSCLHGQPFHMMTSFLPYLLLLPGYINILNIYAFCNTHDVRQVLLIYTFTTYNFILMLLYCIVGVQKVIIQLPKI